MAFRAPMVETKISQSPKLNRLLIEVISAIAAAEVLVIVVLPIVAPEVGRVYEVVLHVAMLTTLAGSVVVWRIRSAARRAATNSDVGDIEQVAAGLAVSSKGKLSGVTSNRRPEAILIGVLIVGCVLLGLLVTAMVARIRVNGPLYNQIINQKDIVADVLPPPAYIIESYLTAQRLADRRCVIEHEALANTLQQLCLEFEDRQIYWSGRLTSGPIRDVLLRDVSESARRFYAVANAKLLPFVRRGEFEEAGDLVAGELRGVYEEHRVFVDQLVTLSRAESDRVERAAARELSSGFIPLVLGLGALLLGTVLVALVRTLGHARANAIAMAERMTTDLARAKDQAEKLTRSVQRQSAQIEVERERSELALSSGGLCSWDWNPQDGSVVLDPRWSALLGLTDVGSHISEWTSRVHPDDMPSVMQALHEHFEGRSPVYECVYRMKHSRGSWLWIVARGRVVARDENGRPIRMVGTTRDITSEKAANALRDGQAHILQLALGESPLTDVLAETCRMIEANKLECRASVLLVADGRLRRGAAPSLPDTYSEAIDGLAIGPNVGSCGRAAATGLRVITTSIATDPDWASVPGATKLAATHGLEACWSQPVFTPDGRTVVAVLAMYYSARQSPSTDEIRLIEEAAAMVAVAVERRRADAALRENEARFRTLVEGADVIVWEFDWATQLFTYVSPQAARLGYPLADWLKPNFWLEHIHPDDRVAAVDF